MNKLFKRVMAVLLTTVIILCAASLNGFIGLNISWFDFSLEPSAVESTDHCGENVYYDYDESLDLESSEYKIPSDAAIYNGHSYKVYDLSISWTEAKDFCTIMGGHLVSITSSDEQEFVNSITYEKTKDMYWIGLYGGVSTGSWKWVTEENFEYSNWSNSKNKKPDNEEGNEDYVAAYRVDYTGNPRGTWNDNQDKASISNNYYKISRFGFICEWDRVEPSNNKIIIPSDVVVYNGHSYKVYDVSVSWTDAEAYCEKLGGHLVSIASEEEQDFVNSLTYEKEKDMYWIGLYGGVFTGSWKWITGESCEYFNWSNSKITKPDNGEGDEDYVAAYRIDYSGNPRGSWNDNQNKASIINNNYNISRYGFICEWDSINLTLDISLDTKSNVYNLMEGSIYNLDGEKVDAVEATLTVTNTTEDYGEYSTIKNIQATFTNTKGFIISGDNTIEIGSLNYGESKSVEIMLILDTTCDFKNDEELKLQELFAEVAYNTDQITTKVSFRINTLEKEPGKVHSIKIDDVSLNYKMSTTIKPHIQADAGVKYTVKYESSNPKVATVDQNGKVTATKRGSGSATITCTVTDQYDNIVKDTCTVNVSLSFAQIILVYVLFGWIWY